MAFGDFPGLLPLPPTGPDETWYAAMVEQLTSLASAGGSGSFTDLTATGTSLLTGNVQIGDAGGDSFTLHPAAWTLSNGVTITGTWDDLGIVTTVDINGGTIDGVDIGAVVAGSGDFTTLTASGIATSDSIITDFIQFNTSLTPPSYAEGQVYWDSADKTMLIRTEVSDVSLQVGQEAHLRATNKSGAQIDNGEVVYIDGAQGFRPTIALAEADVQAKAEAVIGIATHDIADNATGYVTTFGLVRDLNTLGLTEGNTVYLSDTAGAFTETPPPATSTMVKVGVVVRAHATEGVVFFNTRLDSFNGVVGGVAPDAGTFTTLNATGGGSLTGTWTDLGTVSAATSITSSAFVGPLTGNASTATLAATVTVADESTDTTCFPAFFTAASGSLAPKTDTSNLTYNSNTGAFSATRFIGAHDGTVGATTPAAVTATTGVYSGILSVDDTTDTTSTTTGSIHTDGGLGIALDLWVGAQLNVAGTGPHAIGGATNGFIRLTLDGAFTSDGSSTQVAGLDVRGVLTGEAEDTNRLVGTRFHNSIVTQTATENVGVIAQVFIEEPVITDNLTGDITVAASLYIANAPTEGETNAALYVASGATRLLGTLDVTGVTSFTNNVNITRSGSGGILKFENTQATVSIDEEIGRIDFFTNDTQSGGKVGGFIVVAAEATDAAHYMSFGVSPDDTDPAVEAMRIASNLGVSMLGTLAVTSTSTFTGNVGIGQAAATQALSVTEATNGERVLKLIHTSATNPTGLQIDYSADDPNDTLHVFLFMEDSAATRGEWRSNGGIANFQSNDADLSDASMKEMYGVIDGERAFNAIMSLDIETGRYLDNLTSRKMVMITAQNAAHCEDGWCAHDGWKLKDGTTRHATHNKDIYLSHIRATQFLAGRVEKLEAALLKLKEAA